MGLRFCVILALNTHLEYNCCWNELNRNVTMKVLNSYTATYN